MNKCVVYACSNNQNPDPTVPYHSFPANTSVLQAWLDFCSTSQTKDIDINSGNKLRFNFRKETMFLSLPLFLNQYFHFGSFLKCFFKPMLEICVNYVFEILKMLPTNVQLWV